MDTIENIHLCLYLNVPIHNDPFYKNSSPAPQHSAPESSTCLGNYQLHIAYTSILSCLAFIIIPIHSTVIGEFRLYMCLMCC